MGDAEHLDNWQQQLEEVTVLQSICGEDFTVLAEGFSSSGDGDAAGPCEELAATLPAEPLECQAAIHVELPSDGLALAMSERDAGSDGAAPGTDSPAAAGLRIRHLPPLCFRLRFPRGYPSTQPPECSLSALWLSAANAATLSAELTRLWDEQGGGLPICYVWLDWLRATALETIGAGRALRLDTIAAAAGVTGSSKPVLAKAQLQQQAQLPPPDAAPPAPLPQAASRREVEQQRGRHAGHQRSRQGGAASTPAAAAAAAPAVALANGMLNPQARSWAPSPAAGRAAEAAVDASPAVDKAAGSAAEGAAAAGGSSGRSSPGGDGGGGPAAARSPDELCMQLMLYDAAHSYRLFRQGTWQCPVCFEEKPGSHCVRLDDCRHVFCVECVATHAGLHVSEGSLDKLRCLDPGCKERLSRQVLGRLLTAEQMQRIEDLTLQRALDKMHDLIYCPRCQAAAIEDADHCTQCPKCFFVFCSLCNLPWHPGSQCMSPETQLELLRQRMAGKKDGAEEFRRKEEECLSLASIKETAKQCPTCSMATEKSEGCNKMVCGNCGGFWCWKCLKSISGYEHYRDGSCMLFDDSEIARWNQEWDANMIRQEALIAQQQYWPSDEAEDGARRPGRHHCPTCGAMNVKMQNNNHITCWACTTPFCALCRASLRKEGGRHFGGKLKCKQHTRN